MDSMGSVWTNLPARQKLAVIIATILTIVGVLALGQMGNERNLTLLYGGLEPGAAGEVLQSLEAAGVTYEVRGGAIYVDPAQRDALRMSLASQGLPANGARGYELLDDLSGFSTTSQMFDAAYWRAREGELARTILSSPFVTSARVHISAPSTRGFQRDRKPTAAVTVSTVDGALSPSHAQAFRFLVASAVPSLLPADVAVIDDQGGLVSAVTENGPQLGETVSDRYRAKVERLLEAWVGKGNAVVEVTVETVMETEQIRERRIDPDSRIAISTEVSETSSTSQNSGGGDVTVASNLPDGDAAGGRDNSSAQGAESREITNYEASETQREITREPGAIRRLTVAALVNDVETVDEAGVVTVSPRPAEEMEGLRELIASAVGFDEARGDQITVQSLPFEPLPELGTEATQASLPGPSLDVMSLIQLGVMAAVALILGLFVVRPVLMSSPAAAVPAEPLAIASAGSPGDNDATPDLREDFALPDIELPGLGANPIGGMDGDLGGLPDLGTAGSDPVDRLRMMIEDRQDETLQILQSWIEDDVRTEKT